jgi:glyoxylase-like metal-dependent hydrolase (beta-lactamase superfamily II)
MEEAAPGRVTRLSPLVRRLLAPNPSAFTYTGTQVHLVGLGDVAIIDPGPDLPSHVEAMLAAVAGERVAAILCTHTHRDHSPAARHLHEVTGAPVIGCAPLVLADEGPRADDSFDPGYSPDRVLGDGEELTGNGWTLQAVATPGHTSNHLCFALREERALFSGDHVMGWSTSIVSPPDGDMTAYLKSLDKLLERDDELYYPAHGLPIIEPRKHVRGLILHRRHRESQILARLEQGKWIISDLVAAIYVDVDPRLHPAAERSVLAHLIDLRNRGLVAEREGEWMLAQPSQSA